ncbi:MAG: hypothetical protein GY696_20820 [Gammaproteobacteria bacterium]|nr:hypothetical protein [Gammaproteobacteria bacterium]
MCIHELSWNDAISDGLRQDLVAITIERSELNKIRFARSLVPELPTGYPLLVIFSDGSKVAYACISYLCWPTKNGILSTLVSSKTRVAPLKMESIPRVEMLGCVAAARLATSIENALPIPVAGKRFLMDSTVALSQICSESVMLNVFNSHRVGEIQSTTRMEDWRYVPGPDNIADIATRPNCKPADLVPGSVYQNGPSWLGLVEKEWPVKTAEQVKHSLPPEELNSKLAGLQCMTVTVREEPDKF